MDEGSGMSGQYISEDGSLLTHSHWRWNREKWGKPYVTVDFHHTITDHCPACLGEDLYDTEANGLPQDGAIEGLKRLQKHFNILVNTGAGKFWNEKQCSTIVAYLQRYEIPYDGIRFDKPSAAYIIDDRAVHHLSWQQTIEEIWRRTTQW